MEILHFEDLGDTSVIKECSLGANLVRDFILCSFRFFTSVYNLESHRTITYVDIAFWRFGGYECRFGLRTQLF